MGSIIPKELQDQNYLSLTTFRKSGVGVATRIWFAEVDGKLYFMSRNDSGKYKRVRNNPNAKVAPCTIRGKVTGPEFPATVRILPAQYWERARRAIRAKYWLARVPFVWSKQNVYLEISM